MQDTPETLATWLAFASADLVILGERLRIELPERPQVFAQVEFAAEHLDDAYRMIAHLAPDAARLYGVREPEGSSIDPRPRASCNVTSSERDRLREQVRFLQAELAGRASREERVWPSV